MVPAVLSNLHPFTGETSKIVKTTLTSAAEIEGRAENRTSGRIKANVYVVCRFVRWRGHVHLPSPLPVVGGGKPINYEELWRDALVAATLATSMARIIRACVFLQSSGRADWLDKNAIHDAIHMAASASNALAGHRLRRNQEREGTIDDMCKVGGKPVGDILRNAILIRPDGMTETDSEGNHIVSETVCIAVDEIMRIVSQSVPADFD